MSSEIQLAYSVTGRNLYAVVRSAVAQVWNGSSFVAYNGANWTTYAISLTEQGSSGYYVGDFPSISSGVYAIESRDRAGGSPATTDVVVGNGNVEWTGTAILNIDGRLPASLVSGRMPSDVEAWNGTPTSISNDGWPIVSITTVTDSGIPGGEFALQATADVNLDNIGGGGGGSSFTVNEATAIKTILGVPASGTTPVDPPTAGALATIESKTNLIQSGAPIVVVPNSIFQASSFDAVLKHGTDYTSATGQLPSVTVSGIPDPTAVVWEFRHGRTVVYSITATFTAEGTGWLLSAPITSTLLDTIANGTYNHGFVTTHAGGGKREVASGKVIVL